MSPSEPRRPRVALESTIITHGMPYPENAATARALEAEVRAAGAEPATIAVIGGTIRIGLTDAELEWLAQAKDVQKLSRADLPFAVARGLHGSTTVAATMICAHRAGIGVFATVHNPSFGPHLRLGPRHSLFGWWRCTGSGGPIRVRWVCRGRHLRRRLTAGLRGSRACGVV
jgi:hypothetical protein